VTARDMTASVWPVWLRLQDVPQDGLHRDIVADEGVRTAVAKLADLRTLPRFEAHFDIRRQRSEGLHVTGVVEATVGQTCVVTLEPMESAIRESVDMRFDPPAPEWDEGEALPAVRTRTQPRGNDRDDDDEEDVEPLVNDRVDLGALAVEFLMLGIDPYPRKPGVSFEALTEDEGGDHPFAALEALKKDKGSDRA
jgi:uncharacterized metal-binding protein YceD (DUF177 family)